MAEYPVLYVHETGDLGGAENSLLTLVDGLNRQRFLPVFILPAEGRFARALQKRDVKLYDYTFPSVRSVAGIGQAVSVMRRIISEERIALLHAQSIRTDLYASLAGRQCGVPVVWHLRNLITGEKVDPERWLSFLPARIICNSHAVAKRLERWGRLPRKVRVIYNGVNTEIFHPDLPAGTVRAEFGIGSDEFVVGIASRFHRIKGHETFFAAAVLLSDLCRRMGVKIRFLVVGGAVFSRDSAREKEIQELVESLNVNQNVIFTGLREDMPQVYAAMDVVVLSTELEACGRVLIEAMACARPVVATGSGGTPEIIQDGVNGYLFAPGDHHALAQKIELLIKSRELGGRLGRAGRIHAQQNFSMEKNVREIQEVYEEILA